MNLPLNIRLIASKQTALGFVVMALFGTGLLPVVVNAAPVEDVPPARESRPQRPDPSTWVWNYPKPVRLTEHGIIFSEAMQREVGYNIYLPADYETHPDRSYSVVYFLHGAKGNEESGAYMASNSQKAVEAGEARPVIWVYVNGGPFSGYRDWADDSVKAETMILEELIPAIEARYRVRTDRPGRAICGYSMGGNGAMRFAAKYPARFCAVASIAGAFNLNRQGSDDDTVFRWAQQNAEQLRDTPMWFFVGALDHFKADQTAYFAVLDTLNLGYHYTVIPGKGHLIGEMWNEVVPDFVRVIANACAPPLDDAVPVVEPHQ